MSQALAGRDVVCSTLHLLTRVQRFLFSLIFFREFIMQNNQVIQFSLAGVENVPAVVIVSGNTLTEKKASVIAQASVQARAYMCNAKGKVGKQARDGFSLDGLVGIAHAAGRGHYKPLADAIAAVTGETISIPSRAVYDSLVARFSDRMHDLKNDGFVVRKDGTVVEGGKRKTLVQVLQLLTQVQQVIDSERARVAE
jgi:hypothetical protein